MIISFDPKNESPDNLDILVRVYEPQVGGSPHLLCGDFNTAKHLQKGKQRQAIHRLLGGGTFAGKGVRSMVEYIVPVLQGLNAINPRLRVNIANQITETAVIFRLLHESFDSAIQLQLLRARLMSSTEFDSSFTQRVHEIVGKLAALSVAEYGLDDAVQGVLSKQGSDINNQGVAAQVALLIEHGFTEAEIIKEAKENG